MSGQFLYYIPGAQDGPRLIHQAGLDYALDPTQCKRNGPSRGPDNSHGMILSPAKGSPAAIGYYPDRQVWEQAPDAAHWVGYWTDQVPGPDDLVRPEAIGAFTARLADGNPWVIPGARLYPEGTMLPQTRKYAPGGKIIRDIKPSHRDIYLAADEVWQALETGAQITAARAQEIIELALKTNYRVSHAEINLLGLIDDDNFAAVLHMLVSYPMWPDNPYTGASDA